MRTFAWLTLAVGAALSLDALAQNKPPTQARPATWFTDPATGCRVWNLYPQPGETVRWSGACQNGMANGNGTVEWFENGKPTGRTEGPRVNGKLEGRALSIQKDGTRLEGEFKADKLTGRGIATLANGIRIDATYQDGKANGRGIVTAPNGMKYDVDFVDDVGVRGTFVTPTGERYEGEMLNFQPHGEGKFTTKAGAGYTGGFAEGQFHGQGTMNFANGDWYQGQWANSRPNGQGTFRGKSGSVYSGYWRDGCLSQTDSANGRWATVARAASECGFQ